MNIDLHTAYLEQHLSPARYQHSLGVMQVMDALAPIYGLDPDSAHLAGLAHDAGKELPLDQMLSITKKMNYPLTDHPADRDPLYLHGFASAWVAEHEMGITDPLILEAILWHAYIGNTPVQSPVFCWCLRFADMLSPERDWVDLRKRIEPLVFAGRMAEAALQQMIWLVPFMEGMGIIPHPQQVALRTRLIQLSANGLAKIPLDQLPV